MSGSPTPRAGDQRALMDPGALTKMVQAIAAHAVPERGEAFASVLSTASSPAVEPDLATPNPNASRRGELHQAETDDRVVDQPHPWPDGFYARFDPPRVYDGAGHVVAREGQRIRVAGGLGSAAGLRCMFGRPDLF